MYYSEHKIAITTATSQKDITTPFFARQHLSTKPMFILVNVLLLLVEKAPLLSVSDVSKFVCVGI